MRKKVVPCLPKNRDAFIPHINLWDEEMEYLGTANFELTLQVEELDGGSIKFTLPIKRYVYADLLYPDDYWEIVNLNLEGISSINYDEINYLEDLFQVGWDYKTLKIRPTDKTEVKHSGYAIFLPIIFEDGVWGDEDCPPAVSPMPIGY